MPCTPVEEFGVDKFAIAGGVAANSALRQAMAQACEDRGINSTIPLPIYCTDNAAMIGVAAYYEYRNGTKTRAGGSQRGSQPEAGREVKRMGRETGTKKRCTAILLAGGQGDEDGLEDTEAVLLIQDRPVLFNSLRIFERSEVIDDVVLVTGAGQTEYVRKEFVGKYHFTKVTHIVEGGRERYHSVWGRA